MKKKLRVLRNDVGGKARKNIKVKKYEKQSINVRGRNDVGVNLFKETSNGSIAIITILTLN